MLRGFRIALRPGAPARKGAKYEQSRGTAPGVAFVYRQGRSGPVLEAVVFEMAKWAAGAAQRFLRKMGDETQGLELVDVGRNSPESSRAIDTVATIESGEAKRRLRVRLIREGVSKNGNRWTRKALEQLKALVAKGGVPLNFYDMSGKGDAKHLDHWEQLRRRLPPKVAALLPERLPGAKIGEFVNPEIVTEGGKAVLYAEAEPNQEHGWFMRLVDKTRRLGKELGVSVHVPADGMVAVPYGARGVEPREITRVVGWDVVTHPSAGGGIIPALEGLLQKEHKVKKLLERLLRFVPKDKRESLGELPPETIESVETLIEDHGEFVKALFEACGLDFDEDTAPAVIESFAKMDLPEPKAPAKKKAKKTARRVTESDDDDDDDSDDDDDDATPSLESVATNVTRLSKSHKKLLKASSLSLIEGKLKEAKLPKALEEFMRSQLSAKLESALDRDDILEAEQIDEDIASIKKATGAASKADGGSVLESGDPNAQPLIQMGITSGEKALAALEGMLEGKRTVTVKNKKGEEQEIECFRSIKHAYGHMTGDVHTEGLAFYSRPKSRRLGGALEGVDFGSIPMVRNYLALGKGIEEAMNVAQFNLILADTLHRLVSKAYMQEPLHWNRIAIAENVTDFRTWHIIRMGEFANLGTVGEGAAYTDVGDANEPSQEADITMQIAKYGGLALITWEMIVNDDTGLIRQIPQKFARASARTLDHFVWGKILNNDTIYDASALFHAVNHANLVTAATPTDATLKTMRRQMVKQKDIDDRESGRVRPRFMFCGPDQFDVLYELIYSPNKPSLLTSNTNPTAGTAETGSVENGARPNVLRGEWGLELAEIPLYDEFDSNAYHMTADPRVAEMMRVGFLNGRQEPELFVQDLERVGSFFSNEQITYKVRHIYDAVVSEYRSWQGGIPA
jgi:hypothetical protein